MYVVAEVYLSQEDVNRVAGGVQGICNRYGDRDHLLVDIVPICEAWAGTSRSSTRQFNRPQHSRVRLSRAPHRQSCGVIGRFF